MCSICIKGVGAKGKLKNVEPHIPPTYVDETSRTVLERAKEPELKKVGSTGSTLPEHSRISPGAHKARNYPKDVWIAFQAICSVKIAQFIYISLLISVA